MEDVGGGKRKEKKIIKVDVEIMNKNLRGERIDLLFFSFFLLMIISEGIQNKENHVKENGANHGNHGNYILI